MEYETKENEKKHATTNAITSKHISKLHARVQTKYSEMQQKLSKSKSMDVLSSIQEDDVLVNKIPSSRTNNSTLSSENVSSNNHQSVSLDTKKNDAKSCETEYKEAVVSGRNTVPIVNIVIKDESDKHKSESGFLLDMSFKGSLESLTEVRDSDDSTGTPTSPRKSFGSRIGSRIREARRRRQIEKEKYAKNKRRGSYDYLETLVLSNTTKEDIIAKVYKKTKIATVTIALIEITGFSIVDEDKPRYIGCRFRIGSEKRKSKVIKSHDSTLKYQELQTFNLYDDEFILEILVWDKYAQIGRCTIDLSSMEKEKTHRMKLNLEDSEDIKIFLLLTISGISNINTLFSISEKEAREEAESIRRKYLWYRLSGEMSNVGWLSVIIYGAKGLSGNDCYCVLSLNNERVHTATDYKTNAPNWMKVFSFKVTDITSILEITVYDERKGEAVGYISIPLLNIESGKKWYALKDSTQRDRARGINPRILLEMKVAWNLVKASVRVINPKEINLLKSEEKLDRHVLARNIARGRVVTLWVVNAFKTMKTCFEWESRKANLVSLLFWLLFCNIFKMWMLPLLLLVPFAIYYPKLDGTTKVSYAESLQKEKEKRSLRQKIHDFQDMIQTIQNFVGKVASLGESIKNLYNFSLPFVSFLAIFLISVIAFVMYLIPLKYILMAWGIHKFTRKILKPNRIPHSEVLDLLSRVPDDITLLNCKELPLEQTSDNDD
ncbi:unnamed protein product [Leptosia nina]|uniref:C2 domain-containing protein n=1 Tax=Leptosia nina TaxID=320188 RepID=A0AAV1JM43_9NEOP